MQEKLYKALINVRHLTIVLSLGIKGSCQFLHYASGRCGGTKVGCNPALCIWDLSCIITRFLKSVTRWVVLVVQELLSLRNTVYFPVYCFIVHCLPCRLFICFWLLSCPSDIRFTVSDWPFGIFKLVFSSLINRLIYNEICLNRILNEAESYINRTPVYSER